MLRIRLTRTGKKAQKSFRIVVAEHTDGVKRKYIEMLGHYDPTKNPKVLEYDKERIMYWISKGAKPSESVASLLKKDGVADMDQYILFKQDKKSKKKNAPEEEEKPAAPAADDTPAAEEKPAEEPAKEEAPKEEAPAAPAEPAEPAAPAEPAEAPAEEEPKKE